MFYKRMYFHYTVNSLLKIKPATMYLSFATPFLFDTPCYLPQLDHTLSIEIPRLTTPLPSTLPACASDVAFVGWWLFSCEVCHFSLN